MRAKRKPARVKKEGALNQGTRPQRSRPKAKKAEPAFDPDSPFAKLQELKERLR